MTILRFFEILSLIPKEPDKISTPELYKKLLNSNYKISYRTLQRDLEKISSSHIFPLTSTEGKNPVEWFWPKYAPSMQLPIMSVDEALVFKLVEDYLNPLLPISMSDQLVHYYALADATLKSSPLSEWTNKVRIIPNSLALLPAEIDDDVSLAIYNAILQNKRISFVRKENAKNNLKELTNPIGLVFKGNVIYLMAFSDGMLSHLALHQLISAEILDDQAIYPSDFSLDDYIRRGGFDHPQSKNLKIELLIRVSAELRQQLEETPLSFDQVISRSDSGFMIRASVLDTMHIRWWLHSHADSVEILEPLFLRHEFREKAEKLNQLYQHS